MPKSIGLPEFLIILVIIVLVFGARKLPDITKSVAESMKIFKKEVKTTKEEASVASKPEAEGDKPTEK